MSQIHQRFWAKSAQALKASTSGMIVPFPKKRLIIRQAQARQRAGVVRCDPDNRTSA